VDIPALRLVAHEFLSSVRLDRQLRPDSGLISLSQTSIAGRAGSTV
jgi:hypothetical protein